MMQNTGTTLASKPHYLLLDGLRGVAALVVICYHIFEAFGPSPMEQKFNHGYLAVDFFFMLSGFVIGYAYDDRWNKLTVKEFFKRRLIRLHPMVILAAVIGAISFMIQGSVKWDGTAVPLWNILYALILSMLLIPAIPGTSADVRGFEEMFPLNGPSWSLFFEYIGNIFYATFLRKLSTRWLTVFTAICGGGYLAFAVLNGSGFYNMGSGWSLSGLNFPGGMLRITFAFSAGLLLSRNFKPLKIKGAFWICSFLIVTLLTLPFMCIGEHYWMNGLYESICTLFVFPLIVWLGASGVTEHKTSTSACKFLGDISYPLYIVHYPIMYLFFSWVWSNEYTFSEAWPGALIAIAVSIALAYTCLKIYDLPIRKWLSKR